MTEAERRELLARYEAELRRDAWVPGLPLERLPEVSRYADAAQREALIMWHRFDAADTEAIVRRELAHFRNAQGFAWKVYEDDAPANLVECLVAHGLQSERGEADALMVAPAADMAIEYPLPGGARIHEVKSSREMHLLRTVWEAVWPDQNGGWVDVLTDALNENPERLRILIAMVDEKPVASGYAILDPRAGFAYLGGGGVVSDLRGKGLYRALVHSRAAITRDAGISHLAIEASPASRPILERLGFERLTTLRFYAKT